MLEINHIEKTFGAYRALDDVTLRVRRGSIFGLLGPNGAGKTTLIRIINGIIAPDRGDLLWEGKPLRECEERLIGYLPEERGLYRKMQVGEQALYLAQLKGLSRADAKRRLEGWFERLDIHDWWHRPVEELSKGMQQKVQFICTVLHEPRLLIFDEPFSGFDPVNASQLKNEIMRLRDGGATVILSTHNMSSVEEICDDIALLNASKVVLSGSVKQIRESYRSNCYEVTLLAPGGWDATAGAGQGVSTVDIAPGFEVLAAHREDEEVILRVQLPQGATANDLLAALMPRATIRSMREILPSMNDIFIHTVAS